MLTEPLDRIELKERFKNNKRVSTKRKIAFLNDLKRNVDVFCYVNIIYCYLLDYSIFTLAIRSCMQSYLSNTLPSQISNIGLSRGKKRQLLRISYFTPLFFNAYILLLRLLFYIASKYSAYDNSFKLTYFMIGENQINFFLAVFLDIAIIVLQSLLFSIWYTDAKQDDPDLVPTPWQDEPNEWSQQGSLSQNVNTSSEFRENYLSNMANSYNYQPNKNDSDELNTFSMSNKIGSIKNDKSKYEDGYSGNFNIKHINLIEVFRHIWNFSLEPEGTFESSMNLDQLLEAYMQGLLRNVADDTTAIPIFATNSNMI